MASNLATFKTLLAEHADANHGLPSIAINTATDLGQAFSQLATFDKRNDGETDGQVAARYLDEICTLLGEEQYAEAVQKFEEAQALFTDKIKGAWSSVEGIRALAKELEEQMTKISNDLLSNDKFASTHQNYDKLSVDFPVFEWNGTKVMGASEEYIKRINAMVTATGTEPSSLVDAAKFDSVIFGIDKFGKGQPVEVSDEDRAAAIDLIAEVCATSTKEDVTTAVDMMFGIDSAHELYTRLADLKDKDHSARLMFKNVQFFDGFITSFFPIMDAIVSGQVNILESVKQAIIANATNVIRLCELAAYYEIMLRETIYRESYLLPGGVVNGDLTDKFQEKGGTNLMLAHYLRYIYHDKKEDIPVVGVKFEPIIESSAVTAEKVEKDIADAKTRLALVQNTSRTSAFKIVTRDYICKKIKANNQEIPAAELSAKTEKAMQSIVMPIANDMLQYSINFLDAAMNVIVGFEYKGTFVEHLFKELGAAYISLAQDNGNITADDLRQTDVAVIAKLICKFLVDKLVEVVPEDAAVVQG